MTTSRPSQSEDAEALDLLRTLIDEVARSQTFPQSASLRARREPWLVDDLLRRKWLALGGGDRLVPTIEGLQAAQTPRAMEALHAMPQVLDLLRSLYVEDPQRRWSSQDIAPRLGLDEPASSRLLTQLLASCPLGYRQVNTDTTTGRILEVVLSERLLEEDPLATGAVEEAQAAPGPITLFAQDFRGLQRVDWTPEGVCVVAGPNGSGKTTLLEALLFLHDAFVRGVPQAVTLQGGAAGLRRLGASGAPQVVLGLKVGDASWELRLPVRGGAVHEFPGETVKLRDQVLTRRSAHAPEWYLGRERRSADPEGRTCFRAAWEARRSPSLAPLVGALRDFRYYRTYSLRTLRDGGTGAEGDQRLDETGANLFVVLRNWKAAPRKFDDQFAWVLRHARRAFPGVIEELEFDPPVGQMIPTRFYPPGSRTALPMHRAPDGLLVGLLHLTAVAGARPGSVIAIEEMENQLHPHAIRSLLAAMRDIAEARRMTILLTTHSPVLMNAFSEHPDQFYVMEPGRDPLPVPLDQIHDPEWLAHFSLGDLYERLEFGAPRAQVG